MTDAPLRVVDLFCGSGAVSEAVRRAGMHVVASVDNDPVCSTTYRLNHPGIDHWSEDVTTIDPRSLVRSNPSTRSIDLLVVCAPCQPFSNQNRKRQHDRRTNLILEAVRFAEALQPKCIFFENVPGLVGRSHKALMDRLRAGLQRFGYYLSSPRKVDAADLGVPQRRVRCIMLAARTQAAVHHFDSALWIHERRSVRSAIGGLRALAGGQRDTEDPLHFARTHSAITLARLRKIPADGGGRDSLPESLVLRCHVGKRGYPDVYGRMRWDDVAPTLTTGCDDITKGRFGHPEQDRSITLREAALLQTFPPSYKFFGSRRQIATQIGNAVPVAMVEAILPTLRIAIELVS